MNSVLVPLKGSDGWAMIDEEDADLVFAHTWKAKDFHGKTLAVARIDGREVRLNRFLAGSTPGDGFVVIPDNGDYLDCRRGNLRSIPSSINPTQSWEGRRRRASPPPIFTALDCNHPALVATKEKRVYLCVRCDQLVSITLYNDDTSDTSLPPK